MFKLKPKVTGGYKYFMFTLVSYLDICLFNYLSIYD